MSGPALSATPSPPAPLVRGCAPNLETGERGAHCFPAPGKPPTLQPPWADAPRGSGGHLRGAGPTPHPRPHSDYCVAVAGRLGTRALNCSSLAHGGAAMAPGFPASWVGVHRGRARRTPDGFWACSRSQWGRGSPKACEGGVGRGGAWGQVGLGRGGLRRGGTQLEVGSTRAHPPAFWFQRTPFQWKRGGLFYFIFYS